MTILDAPPPGWKRPGTPPLRVQVLVLRRQLEEATGKPYASGPVQWDHRPPVSDRQFDTDTNDTIPPSNDHSKIDCLTPEEHDKRTNGPGGEKRITTLGSDAHRRKQRRHIRRKETAHQDAMAAKGDVRPAHPGRSYWTKKRELQSRDFDKRHRPLRSRNNLRRRP